MWMDSHAVKVFDNINGILFIFILEVVPSNHFENNNFTKVGDVVAQYI
jgi:hypothetical protein